MPAPTSSAAAAASAATANSGRKPQGRRHGGGEGHRQPVHAQPLAHAAGRDDVRRPGGRRVARRCVEHAVRRAQHDGRRDARRDEVAHRCERHADEPQHQDRAASARVDEPPHERARQDGGDAEQRRRQPDGRRIAAQVGHEEGEGGQQRVEVDEDEEVDQTDSHEGVCPQPVGSVALFHDFFGRIVNKKSGVRRRKPSTGFTCSDTTRCFRMARRYEKAGAKTSPRGASAPDLRIRGRALDTASRQKIE